MNAPVSLGTTVRPASLRDPGEVTRLARFVRETEGGAPFHLPDWLLAIEEGCGQKAHMLVAETGDRLTGLLPLTEMHSPFFGRALVSSGFAVDGGILASDRKSEKLLADAGWKLAERLNCPEIEMRGGPKIEGWERREGIYAGFARNLAENMESELNLVPRKQRAEIRKALKNDLTIDTGTAQRDREAHYTVYATSVRNLGTPVFPRALFDAVLHRFGNDADILTVRHNGDAAASVLSLYFDGAVMPYWGGGLFAARHLRANEMMYFALMNHARDRGCTRFDFGRSKVGTGPYAYKKNWGLEPEPLVYSRKTQDGVEPRVMNPDSPKYRLQVALWKCLPLPIANRLGPMLAKGLG